MDLTNLEKTEDDTMVIFKNYESLRALLLSQPPNHYQKISRQSKTLSKEFRDWDRKGKLGYLLMTLSF